MNCKKCNVAMLWLAGALLAASVLFPNGPSLSFFSKPAPPPAPKVTDKTLLEILKPATPEDLARINGVYSALGVVLARDSGERVTTTEQWAELQARTLQLAIDTPGKYKGLDDAIETVFLKTVGTDDVMPNNPDTQKKLVAACEIIANSATR
jgi:hypothetical protein